MVEQNNRVLDLANPDRQFDLRGAFLLRQQQLLSTLGMGRSLGGHPVIVGDDSELNWRGMLESVLPKRYQVCKAIVVDACGNRSEQIDLLIHDRQYSPALLDIGEYVFMPAEAVYAALEVKQAMNREQILYACNKVASVRRLKRTTAPIPHAGGTYPPRQPAPIIGGLLSMDCDWSSGSSDAFRRALSDGATDGRLDVGCSLQWAGFEVSADGAVTLSSRETALMFFVLRLLGRLQAMATVPAIDYGQYASVLEALEAPNK